MNKVFLRTLGSTVATTVATTVAVAPFLGRLRSGGLALASRLWARLSCFALTLRLWAALVDRDAYCTSARVVAERCCAHSLPYTPFFVLKCHLSMLLIFNCHSIKIKIWFLWLIADGLVGFYYVDCMFVLFWTGLSFVVGLPLIRPFLLSHLFVWQSYLLFWSMAVASAWVISISWMIDAFIFWLVRSTDVSQPCPDWVEVLFLWPDVIAAGLQAISVAVRVCRRWLWSESTVGVVKHR